MTTTERERLLRETRWRIRRAVEMQRAELGIKHLTQEQMNQSCIRMMRNGSSDAACTIFYLTWIRLQGWA